MPEQVQDFYPTPSTRSTCIYYTGVDPDTMQEVFVPKTPNEKRMQRALLQYRLPENRDIIKEAYVLANLNKNSKNTTKNSVKTDKNVKKSKANNNKKEFIKGEKVFRAGLSNKKGKKK